MIKYIEALDRIESYTIDSKIPEWYDNYETYNNDNFREDVALIKHLLIRIFSIFYD